MKKVFYSAILIIYSTVCIYIMMEHNIPNKEINHNINIVTKEKSQLSNGSNKSNLEQHKEVNIKNDEQEQVKSSYNSNDTANELQEFDSNNYKKNKSLKIVKESIEQLSETSKIDEITGEFDSYNIEQRKKNQVIKVPIDELISYLSLEEKAKILALSKKLTKEDFNKFQEYLSYKNQKIGVRMALETLEQKIDIKDVNEVKEIFSKYIDMKTVEDKKN